MMNEYINTIWYFLFVICSKIDAEKNAYHTSSTKENLVLDYEAHPLCTRLLSWLLATLREGYHLHDGFLKNKPAFLSMTKLYPNVH